MEKLKPYPMWKQESIAEGPRVETYYRAADVDPLLTKAAEALRNLTAIGPEYSAAPNREDFLDTSCCVDAVCEWCTAKRALADLDAAMGKENLKS